MANHTHAKRGGKVSLSGQGLNVQKVLGERFVNKWPSVSYSSCAAYVNSPPLPCHLPFCLQSRLHGPFCFTAFNSPTNLQASLVLKVHHTLDV